MNWRFAYAIGFHPWEDTDLPFARKISELFDREERGRDPPYGLALDLGTGSGIWGVRTGEARLAGHGRRHRRQGPAARARPRDRSAGVDVRLVRGDVTALRAAGVGLRLPVAARHRDLPRPEQRPARGDGSGGQRGRRVATQPCCCSCGPGAGDP